jgi:hypothetical protein
MTRQFHHVGLMVEYDNAAMAKNGTGFVKFVVAQFDVQL